MQQPDKIPANADDRQNHLADWLKALPHLNLNVSTMRPASQDASFRRYFRVETDDAQSFIAMDAPPSHENVGPFLHVAALLQETGVSVPEILAEDKENGFLLLTDFGTQTYLNELSENTASSLYGDAINALIQIQLHSDPAPLPAYDRELLMRELMLLPEWYLGKHINVTLTDAQNKELLTVFEHIIENNLAQPHVYVHRDYHSRNLMKIETRNPGIIDFQDAVYGPITYDIASLLRDAYIEWEEEKVLDWVVRYWERARKFGLPVNPDIDLFYRDFEWMGLQRHLKILGIFARLAYRDNKTDYLTHIPLLLEYVRKTCQRYKELVPLWRLLYALENDGPEETGYTF